MDRMRASDEERDRVVEQLRGHHEAGRLTAEEFSERMEAALGARYRDELPPLLADLPGEAEHAAAAAPPEGERGCARPSWGPSRVGRRGRGPMVPLLPLVLGFALVGSVGAVAHGHFPWPLLWVGLLLWWFRGRVLPRAQR